MVQPNATDTAGQHPHAEAKPNTRPHSADLFDKESHRQNIEAAQQALVAEFKTLIADTDRLLKFTQESAGAQADELREQIATNLERARAMLEAREGGVRSQCESAIHCTEDYVQNRPWQSIGIAAGVGFLLGLVVRR